MTHNPSFLSVAQELGQIKLLRDIEFKARGAFKETFRATTLEASLP